MEVIQSYLDNMFLNMPQTPETLRAKKELASMMEDKYNELLAEGKKKNEAIGIVISEFGDLEELAQELGLDRFGGFASKNGDASNDRKQYTGFDAVGSEKKETWNEEPYRTVSRQEAEEYMRVSAKASKGIALGVMLCIWSPMFFILVGGIDEYVKKMSNFSLMLFGMAPLLGMVGSAVAIFIYNGTKLGKYEYLKKERIRIAPEFEAELSRLEKEEDSGATIKIIVGVVLCIFSVIPILLFGSLAGESALLAFGVALLLFMVGIAVALFILGGMKKDCFQVLQQKNEYSVNRKKGKKYMETIGGIYWPVVVVIYLAWSFWSEDWGRTWVIWPVAGVLFAVMEAVCNMINAVKDK